MRARALLAFWIAAFASTACASAPVGRGVPANLASASPDPAIVAAVNWLRLLEANEPAKLLEVSQLPLTVSQANSWPGRQCDGMIADETRMERLIGCLHRDVSDFFTTFRAEEKLTLEATDRTQLRTSVGGRLGPPRPGERLVEARVEDRSVHVNVWLLLVPSEQQPRLLVATVAFEQEMILR